MQRARELLRKLAGAEHGQDLIEYAMLAALIAVVVATTVVTLGQRIHDVLWTTIVNNF